MSAHDWNVPEEGQLPEEPRAAQTDCQRIVPTLHRYVEGELDPIHSRLVEKHIALCPACFNEKERLDLERLWLAEAVFEGPALSARLVEKVMKTVRREAASRSRSRWLRRLALSGAAACVAVALVGYATTSWWRVPSTEFDPHGGSAVRAGDLAEWDSEDRAVRPVRLVADGVVRSGGRLPSPRRFQVIIKEIRPIQRGGFQVGQVNPRFVNFGLQNTSCLPQAQEEWACYRGGTISPLDPPGEAAISLGPARGKVRDGRGGRRAPQQRVYRVVLHSTQVGGLAQFRFRDTLGIALRLRDMTAVRTVNRERVDAGSEPCLPDPNADGKMDIEDIAYGLQVLYGAQPPDDLDPELLTLDPECDGFCLRA